MHHIQHLDHKVVLITGASSGLGEALAYQCAEQGAQLILCARRAQELKRVAQKCFEINGKTHEVVSVDLNNYYSVQEALTTIKETYARIDILMNCAGFGIFDALVDTQPQTIHQMFSVNVLGLIYMTQSILELMLPYGEGVIVNIASQAGKIATPHASIYSATKFAVIGFSNALRLELKPYNIHVMTVNPGPINTRFFSLADPTGEYLSAIDHIILDVDDVAKKVMSGIYQRKREVNLPFYMELAAKFYAIFPNAGDWLILRFFNKKP